MTSPAAAALASARGACRRRPAGRVARHLPGRRASVAARGRAPAPAFRGTRGLPGPKAQSRGRREGRVCAAKLGARRAQLACQVEVGLDVPCENGKQTREMQSSRQVSSALDSF